MWRYWISYYQFISGVQDYCPEIDESKLIVIQSDLKNIKDDFYTTEYDPIIEQIYNCINPSQKDSSSLVEGYLSTVYWLEHSLGIS